MKKAQVDARPQDASSTDSSPSAREVGSTHSRRKSALHTETCGTRAAEADEPSIEQEAPLKKVVSKKTSKSKSKSNVEQTDSGVGANEVRYPEEIHASQENELDTRSSDSRDVQAFDADPFPNESQFNAPEADVYREVPYDVQPSSDRFFCSDEKFFLDKYGADVVDDFDDDFDEDFIQLDDMEFNETLDEVYDDGDDSLDYSDDDMDSESDSSDDDDFDKYNSDEDFIEDSDEDFQTL